MSRNPSSPATRKPSRLGVLAPAALTALAILAAGCGGSAHAPAAARPAVHAAAVPAWCSSARKLGHDIASTNEPSAQQVSDWKHEANQIIRSIHAIGSYTEPMVRVNNRLLGFTASLILGSPEQSDGLRIENAC